jgi:3D (Asp-Asp-Asp) domain-containing protein
MLVTAYCPCSICCGPGAKGVTASGKSVTTNGGRLVAADTRVLPFGTRVSIPGYHAGQPVPVLDRGGRIKGNRLDVLFPTHAAARQWGSQWLTVTVFAK